MSGSDFSILRTDPGQAVADKARLALELFTECRESPLQNLTTTTREPARSYKTTTVERRTGLSTRAIVLTTLAAENLRFFRERDLVSPGSVRRGESAVSDVFDFLHKNRNYFTKAVSQNAEFLKGNLASARRDLKTLRDELRATRNADDRATVEGEINLSNLRIRRLHRLSSDNQRVRRFLAQAGPEPASRRGKTLPASGARKRR